MANKQNTEAEFAGANGSVPDNVGEICNVHVFPGFREDEQEAVDMLMEGIPAKGGNVSHYMIEKLIRAAFRGGVASAKLKAPNDQAQRPGR